MKHIIVTGAKGGTGVSIVGELGKAGYEVTGVDTAYPRHTDGGYKRADVLDAAGLNDLFAGADAVVHFGSLPTDHWSSWSACFENVMMGGFNVFQACANTGVKRVACASSMEVYGDLARQPHMPVTEDSPTVPQSIYGSAKLRLEELAADFCRWHGMSIAGFRLGRIIYENSFEWRLKAQTEAAGSCAECLWCYVDARDVADACRLWLESGLQGFRAWNLAADDVCIDRPAADLLRDFFPGIPVRGELGEFQSPYVSDALKQELGWGAKYGWRDLRSEWEAGR